MWQNDKKKWQTAAVVLLAGGAAYYFWWKKPNSTADKVEGTFHQAKGAVKESVGHTIGNERMYADSFFDCIFFSTIILFFLFIFNYREAKGAIENAEGKAQKKVGDIKAVGGK
jgi:uncharacterized protein YjbJ (UPF0337 family)